MPQSQSPPWYEAFAVVEDQQLANRVPKLIVGHEWSRYFSQQQADVDERPARKDSVVLTGQTGAIATTAFGLGSISAGLWRISYYARITTPATTSSSLTVTFSWTDGAVAQTTSGAAITGNTTATHQFGTLIVRADANTPINYETAYSSTGATSMVYRLSLVIEQLALEAA